MKNLAKSWPFWPIDDNALATITSMVALAPNTSETSPWDVLNTFPKLHSRAREAKTTPCTEAPHSKSRSRIEICLTIYETCDRLESFTRDPIGYEDGQNLFAALFFLSRRDPSGTFSMVDDPKPDPDDINGPEKKFLDGCECGLLKGKTPTPKDGEAWVSCDGKGGFKIRRQKEEDIKDFECLKNCGALECVAEHEKHHIKQLKYRCPDACQKGCGNFPDPDDGGIGFSNDCLRYAECYAGRVHLNCINKKQFEPGAQKDCGGKSCKEWLKIFFDRYTDSFKKYKCASPMALPRWIDPSK